MKKVFNYTLHKELWNWLTENPDKSKFNWPKWGKLRKKLIPVNYCFACEATDETCKTCPLDWGTKYATNRVACLKYDSPYKKYLVAHKNHDYELASKYAKQIAELPLRESIESYITII